MKSEGDAADAEKSISDLSLKLAEYYRKNNIENVEAYRRQRIGVWGCINALPTNTHGKTQLPPVALNDRTVLDEMSNSPESLMKLEFLLQRYPFWLDINRKVSEVCMGLGGKYLEIECVVNEETKRFVSRLQGIEDLHFSDLAPFADEQTKSWIKSNKSSQRSVLELKLRKLDSKWIKIEKKLSDASSSTNTEWLLSTLDRLLKTKRSNEDRYNILKMAAKIFSNSQKFELADYCVMELEAYVDTHNLDLWSEDIVRDLCQLKLEIIRGMNDKGDDVDLSNELTKVNRRLIGVSLLDAYKSDSRK